MYKLKLVIVHSRNEYSFTTALLPKHVRINEGKKIHVVA